MTKVVFDTNIYISAFIGSKSISQLFQLWLQDAFDLYVSKPILLEIRKVLEYEKIKQRKWYCTFEQLLAVLSEKAYYVENVKQVDILDHKDDNFILGTLVACKADYLVTGNAKHFIKAQGYEGIKVVAVGDILQILVS